MAKLPLTFSLQAIPIRAALSEGRTEDARRLIIDILRGGKADKVVQGLAADLLKPVKKSRGRQKALPRHWLEIGEHFHDERETGARYEEALSSTARKFGYSETHVRGAVALFEKAREEHDEISRD